MLKSSELDNTMQNSKRM